ncbi:hypothetical protein BSFP_048940 [Burkholderia stabilis]|uniref:Uncharacterized protein n=1 Tax=Burkholderia stabilis TaxID=95485 RepID=A0A1Y1BX67_9BURK|nr:hypothetical protein BSFP_048940 [Burkholderia stabilis]
MAMAGRFRPTGRYLSDDQVREEADPRSAAGIGTPAGA